MTFKACLVWIWLFILSVYADDCPKLHQNIDLPGNDIHTTLGDSPQRCCADCKAVPNCRAFTWLRGVCYLKSSGSSHTNSSGAVSCILSHVAPTPSPSCSRTRRSWNLLSSDDKDLFLSALELSMDRGLYQKFTLIHKEAMSFTEAHGTCVFLFWHRLFLAAFENMLRALEPRFACVTLPFWDYVQDYETMKQHRHCNNLESCSPIISDFGGTKAGINSTKPLFDFTFPNLRCMTGRPLNRFCAKAGATNAECDHCIPRGNWSALNVPFEMSFEGVKGQVFAASTIHGVTKDIENSPHNLIHSMLSGPMLYPGVSPVEPLFFLHHTTIDMLHTIFYHCKVEPLNLTDEQKRTHEAAFQGCTTGNGDVLGPTSSIKMRVDGSPIVDAVNDPVVGQFFKGLPFQYYKLTDSRDLGSASYSYEMRGLIGTMYDRCQDAPVPPSRRVYRVNHVVIPMDKGANVKVLSFQDEVLAIAQAHGLNASQAHHEIRKMALMYHHNCMPGGISDYSAGFKQTWRVQSKPKALTILENIESGDDPMLIPSWGAINAKYFGCRGDRKHRVSKRFVH